MNTIVLMQTTLLTCLAGATSTRAAVRYVNVNNPSPSPPYTTWATAATIIQDAIDVALDGDEIVVTNGVYQTGARVVHPGVTNRVAVTKPLTLRSVNGPEVTMILGQRFPEGAMRCVYLTNGATLAGFSLTNGFGFGFVLGGGGGGVWCESVGAVVTNCVITHNSARSGGGAYQGTLNSCTLTGNAAGPAGGGGGAAQATLNNCIVVSNLTDDAGGGVFGGALNNCVLFGNAAYSELGFGGGVASATANNSTIIGNRADKEGGGAWASRLSNCIILGNTGPNFEGSTLNYSCTTPLPTNGIGNITNAPLFVDDANGNFRLQATSPCINAGLNAHAPSGPDLDGNPRIAGGTVDIGTYEFQSPQSTLSYAWLQQYGLPTDGSADWADPDGDGLNNWQEWRAWTVPTNSLSALRLLPPVLGEAGAVVRWQSVAGRTYFLERSAHLGTQPAFAPLATDIAGDAGLTVYTDTNAVGSGPYFYRVA